MPKIWKSRHVPEILLSSNHKKIKEWRLAQSEAITKDRRADLWKEYLKNYKKY